MVYKDYETSETKLIRVAFTKMISILDSLNCVGTKAIIHDAQCQMPKRPVHEAYHSTSRNAER